MGVPYVLSLPYPEDLEWDALRKGGPNSEVLGPASQCHVRVTQASRRSSEAGTVSSWGKSHPSLLPQTPPSDAGGQGGAGERAEGRQMQLPSGQCVVLRESLELPMT